MAAHYDFRENPPQGGEEEKPGLHPRIVVKDVITTKQITENISRASSLSASDMAGALSALGEWITFYLREGFNVEIEGLGYFSATLKSRPVTDPKEIRAASINFDNIKFRPSSEMKRSLRSGTLMRAPHGFKHSGNMPEEERKAKIEKFLSNHPFINRQDYSDLTGRLKSMALKDLNKWVEEGYLKTYGAKTTKVYLMNEDGE